MALEVDLKFSIRLSGKNTKVNSNWHEYVSFDMTVHDVKGYCFGLVMVDEMANQYIEYHKQDIINTLDGMLEKGNISSVGELEYPLEKEIEPEDYDNKMKYRMIEETDWVIKKEIRPIRWR